MFAMTIHDLAWKILAHGDSLPGETWEETFLRLYQAMLPADSPRRQFAAVEAPVKPSGSAIKTTITAFTDGDGQVKTDPPVIIHTRPAQF